jgi:hypothetical protein
MAKKACVLFGSEKTNEAEQLRVQLEQAGCTVCLTEITIDVAKVVQNKDAENFPEEVTICLDGADLCFILISEGILGCAGAIGGAASDGGCRVISIGGSPDNLPTQLDDLVDSHLPDVNDENLPSVVDGESICIGPDKVRRPTRKEDRVKCQ